MTTEHFYSIKMRIPEMFLLYPLDFLLADYTPWKSICRKYE